MIVDGDRHASCRAKPPSITTAVLTARAQPRTAVAATARPTRFDATCVTRAGISPSRSVFTAFNTRAPARGALPSARLVARGAEHVSARQAYGCSSASPRARAPSSRLAAHVTSTGMSPHISLAPTTRSSRRAHYTTFTASAASTSCASLTWTGSAASTGVPLDTPTRKS